MSLRGLADKVAVVAGGATGIGAATAARLGAEGALVVVGDVAAEAAQRTAERDRRRRGHGSRRRLRSRRPRLGGSPHRTPPSTPTAASTPCSASAPT